MAVQPLTAALLLSIIVIGSCQSNCADSSLCDGPQLKVKFEGEKVKCNDKVKASKAESPPSVSWSDADQPMYVLVMVDPDAPKCRPEDDGKYWRHWVLADIKGEDLKKGNLENAKELTPYKPPTPPLGTGYHRYRLIVYPQGSASLATLTEDRGGWKLADFVAKLGNPAVAAAFQFRTQHD